jgi:uncharacterized LabA/DUF88 family protein
MSIGWFVDGAYLGRVWQQAVPGQKLSYLKLRNVLEETLGDSVDEAYYLDADPDPPTAKANAFHNALAYPPPSGPGLRVKLYWLVKRQLFWPSHMGGGPVVHPTTGLQYELTQQKAVDVGLAFHLLRSHANRSWEMLVLCAGDGDFHEVVQYLVEVKNVDLYLVGSVATMSEDLRPYARRVVEIGPLAGRITV